MGEPTSGGTASKRRRRRLTRDGILFGVGVGGLAAEWGATLALNREPRWLLVSAFLFCAGAPIPFRAGDRKLDALRGEDE